MRAVFAATLLPLGAGAQSFDRKGWQDDYSYLKHELERRYANLAWFGSRESGGNLPALDRRTRAALAVASTNDDARAAITNFVRSIGDGHFSQLATPEPAQPSQAATLPSPEFSRSDPATGCAALNFAPYDLPQFSLPFESLAGFHLLTDGISTPFRSALIEVGDPRITIGIIRIPSFEEAADIGLCMAEWKRDESWGADGKLARSTLRKNVELAWYRSIADILRQFKERGATAVVVDIGNNSGGDDSGDIAARIFTAIPLRSSRLLMTHDSATSIGYFDEEVESLKEALKLDSTNSVVKSQLDSFTSRRSSLSSSRCDLSWVWREQRSWNTAGCRGLIDAGSSGGPLDYLESKGMNPDVARQLHWPSRIEQWWRTWSGPLYVLTDNRTYSAAEMFAAVLRNNNAAKTIGIRTGGDGCGFMSNPGPVILPHSKLRFRVPNCVRLRSDGTDEVSGVRPDIPVLVTDGEGSRARATRLLSLLEKDLRQKN